MTAPVVIAGAGIAGCALALGLHRAGIACVVCEAHADDRREAGAFLALGSSGVRALRAVGAEDAVAAVSEPVTTIRRLDGTGATAGTRPLAADGAPGYRLLTRGALAAALAGRAADRGLDIRYAAGVTAAAPDDDGVTVTLADGAAVRGSLLVGADGLHSTVRARVDPGSATPRPVGQRVHYGSTPARLLGETGEFLVQLTPGGAFGAFPRADRTWWFLRRDLDDPATPPDPDPGSVLLEHVPPGGAAARAVREATEIVTFDAFDLPHVGPWYRDRMLVTGDAAHAASPATGQGASMALEDAVVLAKALRDHDDVGAAAAAYERARRGRTQANVVASAAMSRPDRPPTDADPGERLSDEALLAQLDWDTPQA